MRIEETLDALCTPLFRAATGLDDVAAVVRVAQDEKNGDYQLNGALAAAKRAGKNPRAVADEVVAALAALQTKAHAEGHAFPVASCAVAGPGFINLSLDDAWMAVQLEHDLQADDGGIGAVAAPEKIVIDFSGPNVAKEMHVGHIRSTILGDVLARMLKAVGHEVVRDNHLGDWGTQFGLLIVGTRTFGGEYFTPEGEPKAGIEPLAALENMYRRAGELAKTDPEFAAASRAELAKLQAGDADNHAVWRRFVEITKVSLDRTYKDLGIEFDMWRGESSYNDALAGVVALLEEKKIAREDAGALCIFFADHESAPADLRKIKEPFIVRKKDGAFLYATTDVATALYREDELHAKTALYVVDARQGLHFKQLFGTLALLGKSLQCEHISFGSILGAGGKPLKTREGTNVSLRSVLEEAESRAAARIREEGLDVPESELAFVARAIGIGAVKYADLKQNRASDYVFDWDKMIAFKGNAGPTIQYAYARIASIFRKAETTMQAVARAPVPRLSSPLGETRFVLSTKEERSLALVLLRFADAVHEAARLRTPNVLCDELYSITRAFSSFYEACPILKSEPETRAARLALAAHTGLALARGLGLLGIATVESM